MYVYSHNEVSANTMRYMQRAKTAKEITQKEFTQSVGKAVFNQLITPIGNCAITFYQSVGCVFVEIQNIHFIFNLLQED